MDFVIEAGNQLLPIEVKATARPRTGDLRGLQAFKSEYGRRVSGGVLLHDGDRTEWLAAGMLAVPWWRVL